MYSLLYVSSATKLFEPDELRSLLTQARANNTAADVTGMLLHKDGNFMQLLEGEETTVRKLYSTIAQDPRHRGAIELLKGPVTGRSFANWTMAFRDLRTTDAATTPGYADFLDTPLTPDAFASNPSRAQKLLLMFKEKM